MSKVSLEEAPSLIHKKTDYGQWQPVLIPVPGTTRWVRVKKGRSDDMEIFSSRWSDIISSQALSVWGNQPLKELFLWTDQSGGDYGEPYTPTGEDWEGLINHLTVNIPPMTGIARLYIYHNVQVSSRYDELLLCLSHTLPHLMAGRCGVKEIVLINGKVSGRSVLAFIENLHQEGLSVENGIDSIGNTCSVIHGSDWVVRVGLYKTGLLGDKKILQEVRDQQQHTGLLHQPRWEDMPPLLKPVPHTSRRVRIEDLGDELRIYSSRPSDIISSQALTVWGDKPLVELGLRTDRSGGDYGEPYSPTGEDWEDLINHLTVNIPPMTGIAWLHIHHNNQASSRYDELLLCLPHTLPHLMVGRCGVKEIVLMRGKVSGRSILAFIEDLHKKGLSVENGIDSNGYTCSVIRGSDWVVRVFLYQTEVVGGNKILQQVKDQLQHTGLIEDPRWKEVEGDLWTSLLKPVPHTSRRVRIEDLGDELRIYSSRPSDIISSKALAVWGDKPLVQVVLHTDLSGGDYGEPYTPTGEDWEGLMNHLTINLPPMTGKARLYIHHSTTLSSRYDELLLSLPHTLPSLMAGRCWVRQINLFHGKVSGRSILAFVEALDKKGRSLENGIDSNGYSCSLIRGSYWEVRVCLYRTQVLGGNKILQEVKDQLQHTGLIEEPHWKEVDDQEYDLDDFGPTAASLYQQACKSGTVSTCRAHIVVFGHGGAGKTNLVRCLLGKSFEEQHNETNLLDIHKAIVDEKTKKWEDHGEDARIRETQHLVAAAMREVDKKQQTIAAKVADKVLELEISDEGELSGKGKYGSVHSDMETDVTDETDEEERENIPGADDGVKADAEESESGHHSDKSDEQESRDIPGGDHSEESDEEERGIIFGGDHSEESDVEESGCLLGGDDGEESDEEEYARIPYEVMKTYQQEERNESCVTLWDFGGQSIFYTLHQMFLTPNTIYIVVNDLTFGLDDDLGSEDTQTHGGYRLTTQREHLDYILKCIEARKQHDKKPAQLIAVCTKSDRSEVSLKIRNKRIAAIENYLESRRSNNCQVVSVQAFSSNNPDVKVTRLKEVLKACIQAHETEIPTKWLLFRDKLKKQSHRTWSDVCDIAKQEDIEGENMVRAALWFLHDQGEVMFFPEKQLSNFVITQPEWFIDLVKKVITLEKYQDITRISLDQWKELNTRGIVHEDILTECWKDNKENLIKWMKALLMLAPWSKDPKDNSKRRFVIPSLLPYKAEKDFPHDWNPPPIYIQLQGGIIPLGFTSSLLVSLELYSQLLSYSEDGSAFCNAAMFRRRGYDVWIKEVHKNGQDLLQVSWHPKVQTRALSKRMVEEDTVTDFLDDIRERVHHCQLIRHIPQGHQLLIPCQCGQHFIEILKDGARASHLHCPHDSEVKFSTTEYKVWFEKDHGPGETPHLRYESKLRFPQSVVFGETFMIHVDIRGSPIPEITWLHNDEPLTNGDGVTIQTTERYSKLEIAKMKEDDFGCYVVQAKNSSGFFKANYEVIESSVKVSHGLTDPSQALNPPDMFGVHVTSEKTVIQHPQSSIILTVPEGAVAVGETCTITGQVHTDLNNYQHLLEPEHYFITPVVEYEASSHILQPVQIKIPHCLHDQDLVKNIRVFFSHKDSKKVIKKDTNEAYSFKVEGDMIIIQTMKFGRFYCECSGIPSVFPVRLDLWMTHKLYTTHHVVTLQPVLRLGLALMKDFDFMKVSHPYIRSKLITTKPADGIGQQWEPVVKFMQEGSNNIWKEWESSACTEFNAALLDLKLPSSYITSLPDICLSSKTGGQLKGILNIKLSDPKSFKCREISVRVDEEVTSSDYTESPAQLLYPPSYKQSHMMEKGQDLRLELKLAGKPLPEVSWFHNDEELQNGGNISIQWSESHTVLEMKGAVLSDAGWYQVKASNYLGYFETKIQVLVYEKQAEQKMLMADTFHMRTPDVFGVNMGRHETVFLQHPQSSIILTVPKGACPEDIALQKYFVSGQVHTDLNAFSHLLEPGHCFIAPIIRLKTNIEEFQQPVEIEWRHCLAPGQNKQPVKVFSTKIKGEQAIRKDPKEGFPFYYDDKYIRIKTQHFCLFDCQAHNRRCSFQSLIKLFMSAKEHPKETLIKLTPVIDIGCAEITEFTDKLELPVDPGMILTKKASLYLPGDLCCSKAKTKLNIDMKGITFISGGGTKESDIPLTKIRMPFIHSLPLYALKVPVEATYLSGELEVTLIDEAGRNPGILLPLLEDIKQPADKATHTGGKGRQRYEGVEVDAKNKGDDYIEKALIKATPCLLEIVAIDPQFLAYLHAHDVITKIQKQDLQEKSRTEQINTVIDITTQNIGGRYDGFIKALTETNQCHIVELLASEISQLRGTQGHKAVDRPRVIRHGRKRMAENTPQQSLQSIQPSSKSSLQKVNSDNMSQYQTGEEDERGSELGTNQSNEPPKKRRRAATAHNTQKSSLETEPIPSSSRTSDYNLRKKGSKDIVKNKRTGKKTGKKTG